MTLENFADMEAAITGLLESSESSPDEVIERVRRLRDVMADRTPHLSREVERVLAASGTLEFTACAHSLAYELTSWLLTGPTGSLAQRFFDLSFLQTSIVQFSEESAEASDIIGDSLFAIGPIRRLIESFQRDGITWRRPSGSSVHPGRTMQGAQKAVWQVIGPTQAVELYSALQRLSRELRAAWITVFTREANLDEQHEEPVLPFANYWTETLGIVASPQQAELWISQAQVALTANGLVEPADFASDSLQLAEYALGSLLPHPVDSVPLRTIPAVSRFLTQQLATWYFEPDSISPARLAGRVLFSGRPYYYERIIAHTVVQHQALMAAFADSFELEAVAAIHQAYLARLLAGYEARRRWAASPKVAATYAACIESLIEAHFGKIDPRHLDTARVILAAIPGSSATVH